MESSLEQPPLDGNLLDLIRREAAPEPWAEGEKIPWDDPGFSRRMLEEHLSQAHDAAIIPGTCRQGRLESSPCL